MGWQDPPPALRTIERAQSGAQPPYLGSDESCDLAALLPIDLIRVHTKTDDVPTVTDEQLQLYRQTAIEAAEQYTGALLATVKSVTESVSRPWTRRLVERMSFTHRTKYPINDDFVYLFGDGGNRKIPVQKGSHDVRIPILIMSPDLSNSCCGGPCDSQDPMNSGMQIMYRAGFDFSASPSNGGIPAGILLGMLKYIAWNITHPGDEIYTARNRISNNQAGLMLGTNSIAWASGALELWRQYDPDSI